MCAGVCACVRLRALRHAMLVYACVCVHCYDGVLLRQHLVQASLFASFLLFVIAIFTWVALLLSSL